MMNVFDYIEKELDRIEVGYTSYDGTKITLTMDEVRELVQNIKKKYKPDGDVIYRHAAIDAICKACSMEEDYHKCDGYSETSTWCDELVALRALPSAQPEKHTEERTETHACDCISRQAAIDALHMHLMYRMGTDSNKKRLDDWINGVPSAQPEIIRCTECKHYREYDSEYVENAVVVQCMADRYPISETIPDGWFCAGAERKDNG